MRPRQGPCTLVSHAVDLHGRLETLASDSAALRSSRRTNTESISRMCTITLLFRLSKLKVEPPPTKGAVNSFSTGQNELPVRIRLTPANSSLGKWKLARVLGNRSGRSIHVGITRATMQVLELVHKFIVCMVCLSNARNLEITCTNSFCSCVVFTCLGM